MKHPLANRSGLSMIVHLLNAYDVWAELTKAQRLALTTGQGQSVVFRRLEAYDPPLWKDGEPTLWGEFVADSRRQEALNRYTVDDAGNLLKVVPA